jgi:hypothetical protein
LPTNVVKTPEQEKLWTEAKAQAKKNGQENNYAYIMGIFKKMGGLEKSATSNAGHEIVKEAAGFMRTLMGKNVGVMQKRYGAARKTFEGTVESMKTGTKPAKYTQNTIDGMKNETKQVTKKKFGFFGPESQVTKPAYSSAQIGKKQNELNSNIDRIKKGTSGQAYTNAERRNFAAKGEKRMNKYEDLIKAEKKKTLKTRVKTGLGVAGAGAVGVGAYNHFKPQKYDTYQDAQQPMMQYAGEASNEIEKLAGVWDTLSFKKYQDLRQGLKTVKRLEKGQTVNMRNVHGIDFQDMANLKNEWLKRFSTGQKAGKIYSRHSFEDNVADVDPKIFSRHNMNKDMGVREKIFNKIKKDVDPRQRFIDKMDKDNTGDIARSNESWNNNRKSKIDRYRSSHAREAQRYNNEIDTLRNRLSTLEDDYAHNMANQGDRMDGHALLTNIRQLGTEIRTLEQNRGKTLRGLEKGIKKLENSEAPRKTIAGLGATRVNRMKNLKDTARRFTSASDPHFEKYDKAFTQAENARDNALAKSVGSWLGIGGAGVGTAYGIKKYKDSRT